MAEEDHLVHNLPYSITWDPDLELMVPQDQNLKVGYLLTMLGVHRKLLEVLDQLNGWELTMVQDLVRHKQ